VVGIPGHPVRVEGRKPEGPDTDWLHLPDPVADALRGLAERIGKLERVIADLTGTEHEAAEVRPLRRDKGQNPVGG
jgi:serine O-acetyltransferase